MIASRQCFSNCIWVRRYIFPKKFAVFRFIKYPADNTAQNPFLDQSVNTLLYRIAIRNICEIRVNKHTAVRGAYNPIADLFCIATIHTANLLNVTNIIYDWLH